MLNVLPVFNQGMMANPAIQSIIKGACCTIKAQRKALKREEENADVRHFASHLAESILEVCDEAFPALLEYHLHRKEGIVPPFSVQYNFMFEYSCCLNVLEGIRNTDKVMDMVFEYLDEYIELIAKVVSLLITVENEDDDLKEDHEEDYVQLECDPLPEPLMVYEVCSAPVLSATPVIEEESFSA